MICTDGAHECFDHWYERRPFSAVRRPESCGCSTDSRGDRAPAHLAAAACRPGQDQYLDARKGAGRAAAVHAHDHDQAGRGARGLTAHPAARNTRRSARAKQRPSFGDKDAIYAYQTEIIWDEQRSSLIFRESQRLDSEFTHHGDVSVPNQSGHIYLVTNSNGQYRLIILTRPTRTGQMHGILTTLQAGRGAQLTPVAAPIALLPASAVNPIEFGRIAAGHHCYEPYRKALRRTLEEPFALFLPV
jgi:hypothetical protein